MAEHTDDYRGPTRITQAASQVVKMDDPYNPDPDRMAERAERLAAEYAICKKRGHQASGFVTASNPPQQTCRWCGTRYFYTEPQLQEFNVPKAAI